METIFIKEKGVWVSSGKFEGTPILAEAGTRLEASCAWLELAVQQAVADVDYQLLANKPNLSLV